jgi:hypothetical protein
VAAEASFALSLDVVRAKIFYLACDVETVSPPAAMLLRAVADAIEEGGPGGLVSAAQNGNGHVSPLFPQVENLHQLGSRLRECVPGSERPLGVANSQSGHKR